MAGKHRAPSKTGQRIAALAVMTAAPSMFVIPTQANAAELPPSAIATCESGGDIRAENPTSTASGKWQFIDGTWAAYGGTEFAPRASGASEAEQDIVAARAFAAEGTTPWVSSKGCWGGKSSASGSTVKVETKAEVTKEPVKAPVVTPKPKPAAVAELKVETESDAPAPRRAVKQPDIVYVAPKDSLAAFSYTTRTVPGQFTPGGTGEYTVADGDTLSQLALDYKTTVAGLVAKNSTIIEDADGIYVGEKLDMVP